MVYLNIFNVHTNVHIIKYTYNLNSIDLYNINLNFYKFYNIIKNAFKYLDYIIYRMQSSVNWVYYLHKEYLLLFLLQSYEYDLYTIFLPVKVLKQQRLLLSE